MLKPRARSKGVMIPVICKHACTAACTVVRIYDKRKAFHDTEVTLTRLDPDVEYTRPHVFKVQVMLDQFTWIRYANHRLWYVVGTMAQSLRNVFNRSQKPTHATAHLPIATVNEVGTRVSARRIHHRKS